MTKKEILEKIAVLERQNHEFHKIEKDLDKQVKKNLYWWFLIPFFGFLMFEYLVQKRKQTPQYQNDSVLVKTEITKNEFEILKLKKQCQKMTKELVS